MRFTCIIISVLMLISTAVTTAQWNFTGPYGGYIQCLLKDNQGNILAGTTKGGIFRSSDSGSNWEQIFSPYTFEDVRTLAINQSGHLFAGTDGRGIYRSTNNGQSWQRLSNILSTRFIRSILIKPDGEIFAATLAGVYKSTDNGNTFLSSGSGITTSQIHSITMVENILFAGTAFSGIFKSTDNGTNWSPANNGLSFSGKTVYDIISATSTDQAVTNVYAAVSDKLYRSGDMGITWEELPAPQRNFSDIFARGNGHLLASSNTAGTSAGGSIIHSSDNGNTWNTYQNLAEFPYSSVIEVNNSTIMAGALGRGTYVSDNNGIDWNLKVNKMTATTIPGIGAANGVIIAITRNSGVFKSTDRAETWENITSNIPAGFQFGGGINPVTNTMFALHQQGLFRSSNQGSDWSHVPVFGQHINFTSAGDVLLTTGSAFYKSVNDGQSFQFLAVPGINNISSFTVDQNDHVYLATADINGVSGFGVLKSTDVGITWAPINTGINALNITTVHSINSADIVTPSQCITTVVAGTATGQYYTKNTDDTWNEISAGLQPYHYFISGGFGFQTSSREMHFDLITENEVLSITPTTCLFTDETPLPEGVNLLGAKYLKFAFDGSLNDPLYLFGTNGSGVIKKMNTTGISNSDANLPSGYYLLQIYPNPFNPATKIEWLAPEEGRQIIKVFDILGSEIIKLVDEDLPAGRYSREFRADNLPSGVYIYTLQAGSHFDVKKAVLIK